MAKAMGEKVNTSLNPILHSPPPNTVAISMIMTHELKEFKFSLHSILSFTDYPYMLTVVENLKRYSLRQFLKKLQHNHRTVTTLSYNEPYSDSETLELGLKYMFVEKNTRFGAVVGKGVIVEPEWLSPLVARLNADEELGAIHVIAPCNPNHGEGLTVFRRDIYEAVGGYGKDFAERIKQSGYKTEIAKGTIIHKIKGENHHARVSK